LLKFSTCNHKSHAVEAVVKLILAGIGFVSLNIFGIVVDFFILFVIIGAVFVDFGDVHQMVWMLKVEEKLERAASAADSYVLPPNDGREGGESLLPIQKKQGVLVGIALLTDGEVLEGDVLAGFPQKDCSGGVASIEGIEEVAHTGGSPDVAALHFGEAELPAFDHADELVDGRV
jgi:hypothetical protein